MENKETKTTQEKTDIQPKVKQPNLNSKTNDITNEKLDVTSKKEVKTQKVQDDKTADSKKASTKSKVKKPTKSFVKKSKVSVDGFSEKVVAIKRISKTTKGGRAMRFSVLVVIGDKKGQVGFGMGKSIEIPNAIKKAIKNAKNNIAKILMNKNGTLYHEVIGKSCAAKVLLKPAPNGTGIIAGGAIRAVIEAVGFKDVYTKNLGKNTPINMIRATINGLKQQKTPKFIANMRDKQLIEL